MPNDKLAASPPAQAQEQLERLRRAVEGYGRIIAWALGEAGEFPSPPDDWATPKYKPWYWWRAEMRERASAVISGSAFPPAHGWQHDISGTVCQGCGGQYRYDTSIGSETWNRVIRANRLPEFLCLACIVREFLSRDEDFAATLSGEDFNLLPIVVYIARRTDLPLPAPLLPEKGTP